MRRIILVAIVLMAHAAPMAQSAQTPQTPADGIGRLLAALEQAIVAGGSDRFRAIATSEIPQQAVERFEAAAGRNTGARAVVRERVRRPSGPGYGVVADVFVSRDVDGRIATWLIQAVPDAASIGQFKIGDIHELAAVSGLLRLRLDTRRQFTIKDLKLTAPDLTLTMATGTAFLAESPTGVTGLVLRGKGQLRFSPPDPAEQLQLKLFSYRANFVTDVDTVFVRVNPYEYARRVNAESLVPTPVNPDELAKAQQVFDEYSPKTYNLDVRALTSERWSLEPMFGSLVVEFHTSRHNWVTYTRSPLDPEDISLFDRARGHNICQYSSATQAGARERPFSEDDGSAYDVEHYALDLAFDPARSWVSGRAALTVRLIESSTNRLTIRLAQPFTVATVASPELGELVALRVVGQNNLLIGLPANLKKGDRLTLDVTYAGRLSGQAMDGESMEITTDQQAPPPNPEDRPIITPEPRFMYSQRLEWYPQGLVSDYATADLRLTVPAEYQIVATGRQIGSSTSAAVGALGGTRTSLFMADRPVRYLACLISRMTPVGRAIADVPRVAPPDTGDLVGPATSVNIDVLSTPRMVTRNRQTAAKAAEMLSFYAQIVGEAPYPNLVIMTLEDNLPGGHSPAYMIALHQPLPTTPFTWSGDPVAFDNQYPPFFLAHELAHQWWGQAVGWQNYHEQWLSEGLAQYFAVLFAAQDKGAPMLQSIIGAMRASSQPILGQGPISLGYRVGHIRNDQRAFRSILYNKAAVVLHMLRRFIGDDAFFKGLRRYYAEWRFKKTGTDQLQAAFEAETPLKLDRFFHQWIRGFTLPKIKVTSRMESDLKTGVITIEQIGEVFDFPLTVVLQFADGRTEERTLKVVGQIFEERLPVISPLRRVTVKDPLTYFEQK